MAAEYTLKMRGQRVGVETRINDLPVVTLKEGGSVPGARINHFVVPGHNQVTLYLLLPASRPKLSPEAQASLEVLKNEAEVYAHTWNAAPENPVLPPASIGHFEAGEGFGAWRWQSAPQVSLPLSHPEGLNALLIKMHKALSAKDVNEVMALLALKNKEMAQAFAIEEARAESNQREFFTDLFSSEGWKMEPLDLTGAKHILYANKRVVHTLTRDDKEPLRSQQDKEGVVFSLSLLVSHLPEGWTIVR